MAIHPKVSDLPVPAGHPIDVELRADTPNEEGMLTLTVNGDPREFTLSTKVPKALTQKVYTFGLRSLVTIQAGWNKPGDTGKVYTVAVAAGLEVKKDSGSIS